MEGISGFASSYGLIAILAVMLVKEIGLPIPIPSDLLMVGAGIQVASGSYGPAELVLGLGLAVLVGGTIQFLLARSAGRAIVYRLVGRVGIRSETLDRFVGRLASGGGRSVFLGMNMPGMRAAVIPAAGVARMSFAPFAIPMLAGSLVFYGWHIALGYLVGPAALVLIERYTPVAILLVLVLGAVGAGWWYLLRRRPDSPEPAAAWADAACPACLAIRTIGR